MKRKEDMDSFQKETLYDLTSDYLSNLPFHIWERLLLMTPLEDFLCLVTEPISKRIYEMTSYWRNKSKQEFEFEEVRQMLENGYGISIDLSDVSLKNLFLVEICLLRERSWGYPYDVLSHFEFGPKFFKKIARSGRLKLNNSTEPHEIFLSYPLYECIEKWIKDPFQKALLIFPEGMMNLQELMEFVGANIFEAVKITCEYNRPVILKELLKRYVIKEDEDVSVCIKSASLKGHHKIVEILLKDGRFDFSVDDNYPIRIASEEGHPKVVKFLLMDKRVDPSANENEAILNAKRPELVELLLKDPRVDPTIHDNLPVFNCLRRREGAASFRLFLNDYRFDPLPHASPLFYYSCCLKPEFLKSLLAHPKLDPSINDNQVLMELIYAKRSKESHLDVLLKHPLVDPSSRNNLAIKRAVYRQRHEYVELLVEDPRVDCMEGMRKLISSNKTLKILLQKLKFRFLNCENKETSEIWKLLEFADLPDLTEGEEEEEDEIVLW